MCEKPGPPIYARFHLFNIVFVAVLFISRKLHLAETAIVCNVTAKLCHYIAFPSKANASNELFQALRQESGIMLQSLHAGVADADIVIPDICGTQRAILPYYFAIRALYHPFQGARIAPNGVGANERAPGVPFLLFYRHFFFTFSLFFNLCQSSACAVRSM